MGLLDGLLQGLAGEHGGAGGASLQHALFGVLEQGGTDGLAGLAKNFQSQGLGDIFFSWVSTGDNKPIQSDQLQNALGPEKLQQLTGQDDNLLHQALAALLAGPKTA